MTSASAAAILEAARVEVQAGLGPVRDELVASEVPAPEWGGKLIRPLVGLAAGVTADVRGGGEAGVAVWRALAAVQLAHEASLLHDDVIDGAERRRGLPTVSARDGVARALMEGDHLLTLAYRLAAGTGSLEWASLFARAVERTVAGEKAQAASCGRPLTLEAYEGIVLGKSGELMGAALAAGPMILNGASGEALHEVGRRVGLAYQMLDDLLDYCVHVDTGKPALLDYRRGLWTWPRTLLDLPGGLTDEEVTALLGAPDESGVAPIERCLVRFRERVETVAAEVAELVPGDVVIAALLRSWLDQAEAAVSSVRAVSLPDVAGWEQLMAEHAKSFRFASRLFPAEYREQVQGVYAWCRYTDDLVDESDLPPSELEARLDRWLELSRRAYDGEVTGNALADRVMGAMREAGVPFGYAEELVEGQRMDIRGTEYRTLAELWTYTYRVASVVGLWVTELFGIRDPWMLDRAASLGHAMQLTNILRDVGEDLEAGRLYLPKEWLKAHGLDREDLERMVRTGEIDGAYRELIQRLIRVADAEYQHAAPAVARLPAFYRRPVAVASDVYRGIHRAIEANDYDNLTRRAYTRLSEKLRLGAGALLRRGAAVESAATVARAAAVFALVAVLLALLPSFTDAQTLAGSAVLARPGPGAGPVEQGVYRVAPIEEPHPAERALDRIGDLWVAAVEDEGALEAGLEAVAALEPRLESAPEPLQRRLRAYHGSLIALQAKHGGWPGERMRHFRAGFEIMDRVVVEAPNAADVRYIRLMSGFYLPSILGRAGEVREDLEALARLLPDAEHVFPPDAYPEVTTFVLEHGDLEPAERAELEALLR